MRYGKTIPLLILAVGVGVAVYWYVSQNGTALTTLTPTVTEVSNGVVSGFMSGLLTTLALFVGIPAVIGVVALLVWGVRKYRTWHSSTTAQLATTLPTVAGATSATVSPVVTTSGVWTTVRKWLVPAVAMIAVVLLGVLGWQFGGDVLKSVADMTAPSAGATGTMDVFWSHPVVLGVGLFVAILFLLLVVRYARQPARANASTGPNTPPPASKVRGWVWVVFGVVILIVAYGVLVSIGVVKPIDVKNLSSTDLRSLKQFLFGVPIAGFFSHYWSTRDLGYRKWDVTIQTMVLTTTALAMLNLQWLLVPLAGSLGLGLSEYTTHLQNGLGVGLVLSMFSGVVCGFLFLAGHILRTAVAGNIFVLLWILVQA